MTSPDRSSLERIGVIAHYNLLEALEPTGPGELFRARDTIRGRTVLVRRLPRRFVDGSAREQLERAAEALSAISHPNVIRLFEAGDDGGRPFLVFEHVPGQSLRQQLLQGPLSVRRAVQLGVQIADAVADAHRAGYLHGGLSPESVVITARERAKIPAHELACRHGFDASVSPPRLIDYPSPEEVSALVPDERSDVFSVGAIVYEMLTAKRPSVRGAALPSAANPHVPRMLDDVIMRAVAPNREKRIGQAAALAAELRLIEGMLDAAGSSDDEEHPSTGPSRGRAVVVATIVATAFAVAAWWVMRG
jgi:eukaryotic-like serine/threonine-protein kinase